MISLPKYKEGFDFFDKLNLSKIVKALEGNEGFIPEELIEEEISDPILREAQRMVHAIIKVKIAQPILIVDETDELKSMVRMPNGAFIVDDEPYDGIEEMKREFFLNYNGEEVVLYSGKINGKEAFILESPEATSVYLG